MWIEYISGGIKCWGWIRIDADWSIYNANFVPKFMCIVFKMEKEKGLMDKSANKW